MTSKQQTLFSIKSCAVITVAMLTALSIAPRHADAADSVLSVDELRSEGGVSYTAGDDGSITIQFARQSPGGIPIFTRAALVADQGVENSAFRGNFIAAGVETISFRVSADSSPQYGRVVLRGAASGRIWSRQFAVSPTGGDVGDNWVVISLALTLDDVWFRNDSNLAAKWAADLADVGLIGIEIQQGSRDAEAYALAGLVLADQSGPLGPPAELSPMEAALMEAFGTTDLSKLTAAQRLRDSRGDGMTDLERILAEHDDAFYQEIFRVRTIATEDGAITIKWPAVKDAVYAVMRADAANVGNAEAYQALEPQVEALETGMLAFTDDTVVIGTTYVYRVYRVIYKSTQGE